MRHWAGYNWSYYTWIYITLHSAGRLHGSFTPCIDCISTCVDHQFLTNGRRLCFTVVIPASVLRECFFQFVYCVFSSTQDNVFNFLLIPRLHPKTLFATCRCAVHPSFTLEQGDYESSPFLPWAKFYIYWPMNISYKQIHVIFDCFFIHKFYFFQTGDSLPCERHLFTSLTGNKEGRKGNNDTPR